MYLEGIDQLFVILIPIILRKYITGSSKDNITLAAAYGGLTIGLSNIISLNKLTDKVVYTFTLAKYLFYTIGATLPIISNNVRSSRLNHL